MTTLTFDDECERIEFKPDGVTVEIWAGSPGAPSSHVFVLSMDEVEQLAAWLTVLLRQSFDRED